MIKKLRNPKSELYFEVKKLILSSNFPWFYATKSTTNDQKNYINIPFYGHTVLESPDLDIGTLCPKIRSTYFDQIEYLLLQIIKQNNLNVNCFCRININATHPVDTNKLTVPHYDHDFPHQNLLIYLNDAGGETVVFNENKTFAAHHPKEDDIILFNGLHCFRPSKEKRRLVLVATFI